MRIEQKILRIACAVLLSAAALAFASAFVDTQSEWYQALRKPELQPPPIVFSAVWVLLCALFAASLALTLQKQPVAVNTLFLYFAIAVLNALWTFVFFLRQNAAAAVFVLLLTVLTALRLFLSVYRANQKAAYLLIPYLVWISFALYLNYEIAFLN